jgi:hypothetical protein
MLGRKETRIRLPHFFSKYGDRLRELTEVDLHALLYPDESSPPNIETDLNADGSMTARLVSKGKPMITTKEEAVEFFDIDEDKFVIERIRFNSWPTTTSKGVSYMNYQVRVDTKAKGFDFQKFKDALLEDIRKEKINLKVNPVQKSTSKHCIEVCLFDFHLGKVGYVPATGEYNWSIKESEEVFAAVISQAIAKIQQIGGVNKIILPVGNDFFNINSPLNSTVKGTPQMAGMFFEDIFRAGRKMNAQAIAILAQYAPVEVLMVGGNHDAHAVFSLGEVLAAQFEGNERVMVNNQPNRRKYTRFGDNLIGYDHGDKVNAKKAFSLMSSDEPELFGKCRHKFFRLGHFHKNERIAQVTDLDEYRGVIVERCPSLSPIDLYHYEHAYVGNTRRSKSFIYDYSKGIIEEFYYVM